MTNDDKKHDCDGGCFALVFSLMVIVIFVWAFNDQLHRSMARVDALEKRVEELENRSR